MNRSFLKPTLVLAIMAIAAQFNAQALIKPSNNKTDFLKQLEPGYALNTFSDLSYGSVLSQPYSFSQNGFSYEITSPSGALYSLNGAISTEIETQVLTITFTGGNPTAVGGNFFLTEEPGQFLPGDVLVTLNDGTAQTFSFSGFAGFVTDSTTISSLTIDAPPSTGYPSLDDLYVGTARSQSIPTPEAGSTLLMLGLGLIGLKSLNRGTRSSRDS